MTRPPAVAVAIAALATGCARGGFEAAPDRGARDRGQVSDAPAVGERRELAADGAARPGACDRALARVSGRAQPSVSRSSFARVKPARATVVSAARLKSGTISRKVRHPLRSPSARAAAISALATRWRRASGST